MHIITLRDNIRNVRKRWLEQYARYQSEEVIGIGADRRSIGETRKMLNALDLETCSAEDVSAILNASWVKHPCDECGEDSETLVHFGDEPDYEMRWSDVCPSCLNKALALLATGTAPDVQAKDRDDG